MSPAVLTVAEVAETLRVSRWWVYERIARGELKVLPGGEGPRNAKRITRLELERFMGVSLAEVS